VASTLCYHPWGINPRDRSLALCFILQVCQHYLCLCLCYVLQHYLYLVFLLCASTLSILVFMIFHMQIIQFHASINNFIILTQPIIHPFIIAIKHNHNNHFSYSPIIFSYYIFPTCFLFPTIHFYILWDIANNNQHNIIIQKYHWLDKLSYNTLIIKIISFLNE
jgi:hypothetical protein